MHDLRFSLKEAVALGLVYAVVAFAAFWSVLRSGFVADDWIFLSYVVPASSIAVCFTPLVGRFVRPMAMLTYYANHRLAGLSPLPYHVGIPFGALDIPPDGASCDGSTLRFSGWALDDELGDSVTVWREGEAGEWKPIADAVRHTGTRPDVAEMFPVYPAADSAEWEYLLPCTPAGSERRAHLRIVARDSAGQETVLGERTVNLPARTR